jgi:hypothetical protein
MFTVKDSPKCQQCHPCISLLKISSIDNHASAPLKRSEFTTMHQLTEMSGNISKLSTITTMHPLIKMSDKNINLENHAVSDLRSKKLTKRARIEDHAAHPKCPDRKGRSLSKMSTIKAH